MATRPIVTILSAAPGVVACATSAPRIADWLRRVGCDAGRDVLP